MTNPLVAAPQDSTKAYSGVSLLESANDLKSAIETGDWASVALGAVGTALDALSMAMDPFGAILAAGVGWLMEHVGPLKEALNGLTGNADEIAAQSETWKNVATELGSIGEDLAGMSTADTSSWTGNAADAYRQRAKDTVSLLGAAQKGCEGASSGVKTAGEVVAAVRALVRDIIAELVGHMISWALQVLFTLGIGLTWVVPQVVGAVAKTASKIADLVKRLVQALKSLIPLLKRAGDLFADAAKALRNIKPGKAAPTPKPPDINGSPKNLGGPKGGKGGGDGGGGAKPPPANPGKGDDGGSTHTSSAGGGGSKPPSGTGGGGSNPPSGSGSPSPTPTPDAPPKIPDATPTPKPNPKPDGGSTTPSSAPKDTPKGGPDPAKNKGPDEKVCEFDPIDVATGDVLMTQVDLAVPGVLGELIVRHHVSSYRDGRWFGPSWTSLVDERLELSAGTATYFSADAMVLTFPIPAPGAEVSAAYGPLRWLRVHGDGYVVDDPARGVQRRFTAAPGTPDVLLLREVRAENGESVELDYDPAGAPAQLRHSAGARIAFEVSRGRIRSVRALSDTGVVPVARYDYDERGHLALRANSSPQPARYAHDAEGRLVGWTDTNGVWYRYVYDEQGRCVRTVGDRGFLDGTLSYADGATSTVDSLGHRKTFEFERGDVVAETDKLGGVTRFEWGPGNLLLARTDQLGHRTEFEHDVTGMLRAVLRPDGSRVTIVRHTGTELEIEVVGERTWRRTYSAPELPDPYADPLGVEVGRETGAPEDAAPVTGEAAERDMFGRARTMRAATGARLGLQWTVEGGLRTLVGPDGARQQWTYDGEGQETSRTDELGRTVVTEYGPFGTRAAEVDTAGTRTLYRYDTELRLVAVVNPRGQSWDYTHDAEGRVVAESDFDGRVFRYTYDAVGRLTRSVNAAGEAVDYRYDALGNLVERRTATRTDTYRYDPVGRLVHASGPDGDIELDHDDEGRVVTQITAGLVTKYDYAEGKARRTPSGVDVQWDRETADRLLVGDVGLRWNRDQQGNPISLDVGETSLLRQQFDANGRLAAQLTPAGARRYHYRPDGSLAAREDPTGGARYEYDPLGRVAAVHSPFGVETYVYDVLGNVVGSGAGTGVEAGHRRYSGTAVETAGAVRYAHDRQGRLTHRTVLDALGAERTWTFGWDELDQLVTVLTPDGARWRYRYDPLGRRVAKQRLDAAGGIAEQVEFVWDGTTLVEALHRVGGDLVDTLTWAHDPEDDRPVVQAISTPDGRRSFTAIVTDGIGTPVELVGVEGGAWPIGTSLWGLTRAGDGPATPLRFPGQYYDAETGLHFNVYRYYDPGNGRYLSPDPLGLAPAPNPVAYVPDPLTQCDPLGLTGTGYTTLSGRVSKPCKQAQPKPYDRPSGSNGKKPGGTSSSTPKPGKSGPAPDYDTGGKPWGDVDMNTGRHESQGGGTTSGKHTLDGSPQHYGSGPQPGHATDVGELNKAARDGKLSPELQAELDTLKKGKGPEVWIKGHLQNDNLGGHGVSDNLTPLTSTANKNMSKTFEEPLKKSNDWIHATQNNVPSEQALVNKNWTPAEAKQIREDISNLKVDYEVKVSDNSKFPDSTNDFEKSIRDHVELNAQYKGMTPLLEEYLRANGKWTDMPKFPPPGTTMDTITGKFTRP